MEEVEVKRTEKLMEEVKVEGAEGSLPWTLRALYQTSILIM